METRILAKLSKLALTTILAFTGIAVAQEITGTLTGIVTDATGASMPNATVTVTNKESNQPSVTKTDGSGIYFLRELRPGHYAMKFESQGFAPLTYSDVTVMLGKLLKVDGQLKVGTLAESIVVNEAAPMIDLTGTTVANTLTKEEFNHLPKTRSFQSLALLAPFTNAGEIEGGLQVNGASGAENNYMVDGLSNTSLVNGKSRQNAAFEYLGEVNVKTTGIEAEYGGALGGVINAVTLSGGNQFHGEGHYYYSGNAVSASPVQRLVLDPLDDKTVTNVRDARQKDNTNEIGGSLGGYL